MAFFFLQQGPDRGGRRAMEEIERERKNVQRERERDLQWREKESAV